MQRFFWCLVLTGMISSCVPNKRIVYLQSASEPKAGTVKNADSPQRTYDTQLKDYTLKPGDIITVRIATITPGEFDFVQKYEEQLGLIRKLNQYDQANQSSGQGQGARMGGGAGGAQGADEGMSAFALDRMQTGFILDQNGNLDLPYIGSITLAGLSLPQTELFIKEKLKGYFETPVVRVQLLSFHFTILGEVNKEGRYTIYNPNATIIDAITIAENLNDLADRSAIKIVRMEGSKAVVSYINMLSEDLLTQPGYFLQPNDVIIVPPLRARYTSKYVVPNYRLGVGILSTILSLGAIIITLSK